MKRFLATVCATLWVLPSVLYAQGLGASQLILTNSSGGGVILQPDPMAPPPLQPLLITPPPAAGHRLVYTPAWTLNRLVKWTNAAAPVLGNSLISDDGTTVEIGNGNLSITNTDNTARELRLYEPSGSGTNYTAFRAQAQTSDITYTLPASLTPTSTVAAGILQTDGSGNLSWVTPAAVVAAGGAWLVGGNTFVGAPAVRVLGITSTNGDALALYTDNAERVRITAGGNVGIGTAAPAATLHVVGTAQVSGNTSVGGDLSVGGNGSVTGNLTVAGNTTLGDNAAVDLVTFNARVQSHVVPSVDNTYDLGEDATPLRWRSGYFGTQVKVGASVSLVAATNALEYTGGDGRISVAGASALRVSTNGVERLIVDGSGHVLPGANNAYDLGSSSLRWANIYGVNGSLSGGLTVAGTLNVGGGSLLQGNTVIGGAATDEVQFVGRVVTDVLPKTNNAYNLGSSLLRWANVYGVNGDFSTVTVSGLTPGSVIFAGTGGALSQNNAKFFWDNGNERLGIGTNTPAATLHVVGTAQVSGNTSVGGDLSVGGDGSVTGNLTVAGNTTLGDAAGDVVVFTARVGSHVVPSVDNTYDLGEDATPLRWRSGYFGTQVKVGASVSLVAATNALEYTGGDGRISVAGASALRVSTNGVERLIVDGSGHVLPGANNAYDLGSSSLRWANIYGDNGSLSGSLTVAGTLNVGNGIVVSTGGISVGGGGATITGNSSITGDLTVTGHVSLGNTDNTARELRLYEPSGAGTNFTAFRAQAQTSDITYTLPASLTPTSTVAAGILQTDGSGNLSWVTPAAVVAAGGAWLVGGNTFVGGPAVRVLGITSTNGDELALYTDNAERVRITAGGNVGIGTSTPAATLHVVGTAQVSGNTSVGGDLSVGGNGSVTGNLTVAGNTTLGNDAAVDLVTFNARVQSNVVPSANNAYDLGSSSLRWANIYGVNGSLSGSLTVAGTLNVGNGIVVAGGGATIVGNSSITDGHVSLGNTDNTARELRLYEPSGSGTNYTAFRAQAQASDITYTLPASLTPTSTVAAGILQTDGSGNLSWVTPAAVVAAGGAWLVGGNTFVGAPAVRVLGITSTNGDELALYTDNAERVRITAGGNVGIGTASPSALLHVAGTGRFDGQLTVTAGGAAITGNSTVTGTLTVSSDVSVGGNLTVAGNTTLGDAAGDVVVFTARVGSHVVPSANNTYDLGSSSLRWANIYGDNGSLSGSLTVAGTLNVGNGILVSTGGISVGGGGATITGNSSITGDLTVTGHVSLTNTDGTARELRLYEPFDGTNNYTAFRAQAQASDITYTLPASLTPTSTVAAGILQTDGSGNLSWVTPAAVVAAGGAWLVGGNTFVGAPAVRVLGITSTNGDELALYTDNAERVRITAGGNVGIGTASPSALLHVAGTGRFDGQLTVTAGGAAITGNSTVTGTLTVSSDVSVGGNLTVAGNTTLGDAAGDVVVFTARVGSHVVPSANNTYDLGSSSLRWANIYGDNGSLSGSLTVAGTLNVGNGIVVSTGGISVGGGGATITGNSSITGDLTVAGHVSLTNTDNTARELRLYEPSGAGTNFTAFRAQAQASDIIYTLPADLSAGTLVSGGRILQSDASGNLSWLSPAALAAATAWALTGNSGTDPAVNFLGTTDAQPLVIRTNNIERLIVDGSGHVLPGADNVYNLGSPTQQWANLYAYNGKVDNDLTVSNTLNVGNGIVVSAGGITVGGGGATILGNSSITGDLTVGGHVLPGADNTYDLGSPTDRWANLYASTGQVTDLTVSNTLSVGNGIVVVGDLSTSGGTVAFSETETLTNTGSALTLPDDVAVVEIVDGAGAANINVNPPTSGTQGQLLFIRYSGTQNLTLVGVLPNGGNQGATAQFHAILMYIGGAWRLMSFVD